MKWKGPVCKRLHLSNLGMGVEGRRLRENGNKALIVPYLRFRESEVPVVIIHGHGPVFLIRDLTRRLHDKGRQVMIVYYDNSETAPHESGRQIAQALVRLRERHYPMDHPMDLLAHSMGGIVGRCALNYLYAPDWMGDPGAVRMRADVGGYGKIRFRTADTGIDGYGGSSNDDDLNTVIEESKKSPLEELYADSPMFRRMYSVPLSNVDFQNTAAYRERSRDIDYANSLPELSPEGAYEVLAALTLDQEPTDPQLRNLVRGLQADSRYFSFWSAVQKAVNEGRLTLSQDATPALLATLTEIYDAVMPRVRGRHIWLLTDHRSKKDEIVDRWVGELA